jgi:hypothetical protein
MGFRVLEMSDFGQTLNDFIRNGGRFQMFPMRVQFEQPNRFNTAERGKQGGTALAPGRLNEYKAVLESNEAELAGRLRHCDGIGIERRRNHWTKPNPPKSETWLYAVWPENP